MNDCSTRQLDVSNVFLHGSLSETVYMQQQPGFTDPNYPFHVCHLQKMIYDLKKSPWKWFLALSTSVKSLGFTNSQSDPSLFLYHDGGTHIFLLVYVDDIIFTENGDALTVLIIQKLDVKFALKDPGSMSYFLGIKVILCK